MTSLMAWIAADSRGYSSLYMATDSRLSWNGGIIWDEAKKVYASDNKPFIFSFCGDALFPTHALVKVVDQLNIGFLNDLQGVKSAIRKLWTKYTDPTRASFTIYIGSREECKNNLVFVLTEMQLQKNNASYNWKIAPVTIPEFDINKRPSSSEILVLDGSGKEIVDKYQKIWNLTPSKRTSRSYYSAFSDAIGSSGDRATGGSPQLGGLYRIGGGRLFGVIHEFQDAPSRRYFGGADLTGSEETIGVEWRNDLFERADGIKNARLSNAQVHEPRRLQG